MASQNNICDLGQLAFSAIYSEELFLRLGQNRAWSLHPMSATGVIVFT